MKTYSFIIVVFASLLMSSCASKILEEEVVTSESIGKYKDLTFQLLGNQFTVDQEAVGRGTLSTSIKYLGVFLYTKKDGEYTLYKDSVSLYKNSDLSDTYSFTKVAYGTYTVVALAIGSTYKPQSMDNPKDVSFISFDETISKVVPSVFLCTKTITVGENTPTAEQKQMQLEPSFTRITVNMNGEVPTSVNSFLFTLKNVSYKLNCITGFASEKIDSWTFVPDVKLTDERTNRKAIVNCFVLENKASESGITIILDAKSQTAGGGEVKYSHTFENVPVQNGAKTTYTGNMFEKDLDFSITVNNTLSEGYNENY